MSTISDISHRTKWILSKRYIQAAIVIGLVTLGIAVPFFSRAFALTDVGNAGVFQLDGTIHKTATGTFPTNWDALFSSTGSKLALPPGGLDSGFVNDAITSANPADNTIYTTGSKDINNISNAGWQCTSKSNLTPKDKILDIYSFAIVPSFGNRAGHLLIYAGYERFANSGAGDIGIWLLQDPTVNCTAPVTTTSFNGTHTVGDLLFTAEFSTGGAVTTLNAFEWVGTGGNINGVLTNVTSTGANDCTTAAITANFCARSNSSPITTPWPVQDKTSAPNTLATSEFFDIGIDLTGLLGSNPPCINRFLFDSRASPSPTADLHDFAVGSLSTCPKATISTSVSPSPIALGSSASDTATVGLTNPTGSVSGTVTFNAYASLSDCLAGTNSKFTDTEPIGPAAPPASVSSKPFTPTAPGTYYWLASYAPATPRNGTPVSTKCGDSNEILLVIQSSITTSVSPTPIALGSSATDTATVTLTPAGQSVSGSVTFKVYGPFGSAPTSTSCTGSFTTLGPVTISGPSPAMATSPSFTATLPGYYAWTATYTSNGPANGPNASTSCGDSGETLLVVNSTVITSVSPPTITFGQSSTDTATVTLSPMTQPVMGTVTFTVYGPVATNTPTCTTANLVATIPNVPISGSGTGATASGTFKPPATGYYFWIAVYSPTGPANGPTATTKCGDGGETLVVSSIPKITGFGFTNTPTNNDPTLGSGAVSYTFSIHNYGTQSVTLTGSVSFAGSTASVTGCAGNGLSFATVPIGSGADATFTVTCSYSGNSGQTVSATINASFTDQNGFTGPVSGSPTTYTFTVQKT